MLKLRRQRSDWRQVDGAAVWTAACAVAEAAIRLLHVVHVRIAASASLGARVRRGVVKGMQKAPPLADLAVPTALRALLREIRGARIAGAAMRFWYDAHVVDVA